MTDKNSQKSVFNKIVDCVNSGINWTTLQIKSACPHKRKKLEESEDSEKNKEADDIVPTPKPSPPLDEPCDKICPSLKHYCFIKMQDPCAPCCCEPEPNPLPPCPPKDGPQEPREPICGCELCQKNPNNDKCCDKRKAFRDITIDRGYFEKA